jgi:hypothetical protein
MRKALSAASGESRISVQPTVGLLLQAGFPDCITDNSPCSCCERIFPQVDRSSTQVQCRHFGRCITSADAVRCAGK